MKQLFQNLKNGKINLLDAPMPNLKKDHIIIKTNNTLISKGTEKMLLEFGQSNLVSKAISHPNKVKDVLDKISTEGLNSTLNKVKNKLDEPIVMGYCNVGEVIESDCKEFKVGDRVVSNGNHAEIVSVHKNLCCLIPKDVSDKEASFTVLSSIALNGIRLTNYELGGTIVVYGLGLIGLLTCQLLISAGCNVIGIDINNKLTSLASSFGVKTICSNIKNDKIDFVNSLTKNYGADSVIITAAAKNDNIINESAEIVRKKGSIVLIGVIDLKLNRDLFYKKEILFKVSSSYGPGRYETDSLLSSNEIPLHVQRWSVSRNFQTCLNLIVGKKLSFEKLITHEYDFANYQDAYDIINKNIFSLAIILNYTNKNSSLTKKTISINKINKSENNINHDVKINFIGSGNYAKSTLMPLFKNENAHFCKLISETGTMSSFYGNKFNFEEISTDIENSIKDESNTVVICTQHDSHAKYVIKALESNKNVFVEKPLCLNFEELELIKKSYYTAKKLNPNLKFVVGFNRRFSPHVIKVKNAISKSEKPISFNFNINAGFIEKNHWINDLNKGGGRLIGEACHFLDLATFFVGSEVTHYSQYLMNNDIKDTFCITLKFSDGSVGNINYFSNGNKSYPKEKIEIFSNGKIYLINNFLKTNIFDSRLRLPFKTFKQDKGQKKMINLFIDSIKNNKKDIISIEEIFEVSKLSILINEKEI